MKFLSDYTNMQIHPSSPNSIISAEDAATKIQAGFRGYRVRKQLKENIHNSSTTSDNSKENNENVQNNNNNISQNGKINGELKMNDEFLVTSEEQSATKIQAGVRGFLVRKKQKVASNAATKIQAGFRGFRARKELKKLKG